MRRFLLTAAGWLLTTTAVFAQLGGRWGLDIAACTAAFSDGVMEADLKAGIVRYYESACTITAITPIGTMGMVWHTDLVCSGEGMTWNVERIFAVEEPFDGGPSRLTEIDLVDGFVVGRVRCP